MYLKSHVPWYKKKVQSEQQLYMVVDDNSGTELQFALHYSNILFLQSLLNSTSCDKVLSSVSIYH